MENIFSDKELSVSRILKETALKQKAKVFWFTGLSGAGKSTLAKSFEEKLMKAGYTTAILDGDNVRASINKDLGFSLDDRMENIRRVAHMAKLFRDNGLIAIVSFISPTNEIRRQAKKIIGADDFIEVYLNAPLAVCEERDVKGLYKKARKGEIPEFSGISSPFEIPEEPALIVQSGTCKLEECADKLFNFSKNFIEQIK